MTVDSHLDRLYGMVLVLAFGPLLVLVALLLFLGLGPFGIGVAIVLHVAYATIVIRLFLEAARQRRALTEWDPVPMPALPGGPPPAPARSPRAAATRNPPSRKTPKAKKSKASQASKAPQKDADAWGE